tara:strand:+ start:957 stop:2729 length:1773 start_codon:yes stop_codon:yes gene_type:complete
VFDITPVRTPQVNLDNPFDTNGTTTVTVNWVAHGCTVGDFVLINHATSVDFVDADVNQRLVISNVVADAFDITIDNAATGTTTGTGGFGVHLTCLETIANPFAAISGDPVLAVAHTAHGASTGDYVTYFDATSTDFDDAVVNTNHLITAVDADNYTITMSSNALATSAGVTGGNVVFQYEVPVGNIDAISNVGFGAGGFGLEPWGTIRVISTDTESLRYWSLDHFGEDLMAVHESGRIYRWKFEELTDTRAELIPESPSATDMLTITNPDRHLVALATEELGFQDKMLVRWADQETTNDWTPTAENTAGSQVLSGGSKIFTAERGQSATLIWTDGGLHAMTFIGPPFTFGFEEIGRNCGAISKGCVTTNDSVNYWMGKDDFYIYDGVVKTLPCTVHRYVFDRMNQGQSSKVVAGLIKKFHEIIWFYPTTDGGDEISDYVIYNYLEQTWTIGQLVRTAWLDVGINPFPYGVTADGTLFIHEKGRNANDLPMDTYIESAQMDIGEGDNIMFVSRLIPDMTILGGDVDYTFKTRQYPHATKVTDTVLPVDSTTYKLDTRVRARQIAIRIASDGADDEWYMGKSRIGVRAAGRK